jgi:hypothetical protein
MIERRVDRLTELVRPKPGPTVEQERIIRVAVALVSLSDMPSYSDKNARNGFISNLFNTVGRYEDEIDGFEDKEFENRVCRLGRTISEMDLSGNLNPILIPFEQRIHYLFLNPPKWLLRGPIKESPYGILKIDEQQFGAIYSTSYWTEADLMIWENRRNIIRAARERVPQMPGRQLHQKYFYDEYLTCEEKLKLETLPQTPCQRIFWPGLSGEEFAI